MLRVDGKQGPPKDGNPPLELFQVGLAKENGQFMT
jgi:hypothetical protein